MPPADTAILSADGKSRINPVNAIAPAGQKRKADSVLVVGFPGAGLAGSIAANFIIQNADMHQIAYIDSEHLDPVVIHIGGKLRHPFRIYSDGPRRLYALICEAPIRPEGVHSIMDLVVGWSKRNGVGKVVVLDGIPVKGFPNKGRRPIILSNHLESHNSNKKRIRHAKSRTDSKNESQTFVIGGQAGGLLAACLSNEMQCSGVLIHTSNDVPDPEGAALLLEEISAMPDIPLELDVEPLRHQGREIKRSLKDFMNEIQRGSDEDGPRGYLTKSRIYG